MSETADAGGAGLTPEDAVETIERASSFDAPLRRRTEGVTWMIWGLVAAGIQLTFGAVSDLVPGRHAPGWVDPIILLGWPALALLMTYALWRIAVFDRPGLRPHRWRSVLGGLLWLPVVYLAMGALYLVGVEWQGAVMPLIGIGVTWLTLGVVDAFKTTRTGRHTLTAIGAVILAVGLGTLFGVDLSTQAGRDLSELLVILVAGGVPIVAGFWQSLTG